MRQRAANPTEQAPTVTDAGKIAAERRLAVIVEGSEDAIVSATVDGTIESWNCGAERLYGYSAAEMIGDSVARLFCEGEDSDVAGVRERLLAGGPVREFETRGRRKDGSAVEVSVSLEPIRDEHGRVVAISSIAREIGERKAAERKLAESRERFERAFENAPIAIALTAIDGTVVAANGCLCELVARSREQLLGTKLEAITHPDDRERARADARRLLAGEQLGGETEKRYLRADGSVVWGLLRSSLVRDLVGKPVHVVSHIVDITDKRRAEVELMRSTRRLHELALKDPLTGLRNYRDFREALEREIERARRYDRELSLAVFDLDGFAQVNAELGFEQGDRRLVAVAELIERASRTPDLAGRLGADDFALILPETDAAGARVVTERINAEAAAVELPLSGAIASWPESGASAERLLSSADRALRAAKTARERADAARSGQLNPGAKASIERILRLAREMLDTDLTFLGEFVDQREIFLLVEGASFEAIAPGGELALSERYCQRVVEGQNRGADPRHGRRAGGSDLAVTRKAGIGAYVGVPVSLPGGELYGALCGLSGSAREDLSDRDLALLAFLGELVAEVLAQDREAQTKCDAAVERSGIDALVAALEARDLYTGEHSKAVVRLARAVGERLGLRQAEVIEAEEVAALHDIGKVGIPDSILLKQGPLSDSEWALMREHPAIGERIIANTRSLAHLAGAIRAEHEHYDGSGYPDGLKAEEIPLASRITLACDAYHAMTSNRPYRAALSASEAVAALGANAGTQFDPR